MQRQPVDSNLIKSVGYDLPSSILEVEFLGGRVYHYFDVPLSVHTDLMAAESLGSHFNEFIRDMYSFKKGQAKVFRPEGVLDSRYAPAKNANQILRFVTERIAQVMEHPLMYGGDARGVDLILHTYLELWAEIVGRPGDLMTAEHDVHLDAGDGSSTFADRERRPEASEDEVARYVVGKWLEVAARCNLDVAPKIEGGDPDRPSSDRETP